MKSTNKPVALIIYGPMAVGKLTVAKVLQRKLEYKLVHNHAINDLVDSVFERGTYARAAMIESLQRSIYEAAVKAKKNIIVTHAYSHNYISHTGLTDPQALKIWNKKLSKAGARVCFVHLKAKAETLLSRINRPSRKKFLKLVNKRIMKNLLKTKNFQTSASVPNQIVIDNSKLSPGKVANIIIKRFKLRRD